MVGHKIRSENGKIYIGFGLCKGRGEITGEFWFELNPDQAKEIADQINEQLGKVV
jgi:hypothetical protein